MSKLKLIFAGTPDFSARHLDALINSERFDICAIYTQPDRKAGRGKKLTASPVKALALQHDLIVEQPLNFKDPADVEKLKSYNADVMVVVAYGLILPQEVLDAPTYGCINVHASILPRWRGAAPIQRAIESGDEQTGVTIMQMELGLDTGPMLKKVYIDIGDDCTGGALHDELITIGCPALLETLKDIASQSLSPEMQDDALATYAHKLSKADAQINWRDSAINIARKIRAFNPFPVAWFEYNQQAVRVLSARATNDAGAPGEVLDYSKSGLKVACGEGAIEISTIQLPGKRAMAMSELLNGSPNAFTQGETIV